MSFYQLGQESYRSYCMLVKKKIVFALNLAI
jgi:hypothetical protein